MTNIQFQIGDVVKYNSDDNHGIKNLHLGDIGVIYSRTKFNDYITTAIIHWVNKDVLRIEYLYNNNDLMILNRPSDQPIQFNSNELVQIKNLAQIVKDTTNSSSIYNIANAIKVKIEKYRRDING